MGQQVSMEDQLIDLKLNAKTLERAHKKCEKSRAKQLQKLKGCIKNQDSESARIYAENAIREKQTGLHYLRLASRLDAVASRIESAMRAQQVSEQMRQVCKVMGKAMQSMDVEQMSATMSKFEDTLENIDVATATMTGSMDTATATMTPQEQVDDLIARVADENGLEVDAMLADAGEVGTQLPGQRSRVGESEAAAAESAPALDIPAAPGF